MLGEPGGRPERSRPGSEHMIAGTGRWCLPDATAVNGSCEVDHVEQPA